MKKLLLMWIMLLGMGGVISADDAIVYVPDVEKTSIAAGDIFAIYNKTDNKYLYGSGAQNLGYDIDTNAFASTNSGWLFKAENVTVDEKNYLLLRLITPTGENYFFWGWADGYLNSQPATGSCSFLLGLNNQNGQDIENGAVWDIQYDSEKGGFSLKNIGTGLYLNNNGPANNETPVYWTLCTLKEPIKEDTEDPGVKACPTGWTDMITNGTLADNNVESFYIGNAPANITSDAGRMKGPGIKITSKAGASEVWDTQFFIVSYEALPAGTHLHIEFDYKADAPANVTTQAHSAPGAWISNNGIGNIEFGVNWRHFEYEYIIPDDNTKVIAFNLNENKEEAITFYFDNLVMWSKPNKVAKPTRTATDAKVISLNDFTGETWNEEEKTFTGSAGFSWTEGVDLSQYQYLVVTSAKNLSASGYEASIKDKSGTEVTGDEYGAPYMNMWFGQWNNHNCMCIDLEHLRLTKEFDIYNITDLTINGGDGFMLGNVYATNQKPNNKKEWANEDNGDFKIENLPADKFGTICLPWQAAVAGAFVYEITGAYSNGISLTRVEGLLEAGKPYIYRTNGNNAGAETNNIYFYKATAATVATPVENNGLIGTFAATTAPQGDNFYVLSNNKLYYTTGATVNVGANKAYIDKSKIVNKSSEAKERITINFNDIEATGIEAIDAADVLNNGKIYDLSGREVSQPTRGIYIMNGKKIVIK